jgi:hypothetical protein
MSYAQLQEYIGLGVSAATSGKSTQQAFCTARHGLINMV